MVSPDQAEQAADSLLEPAKQKLAAKQEKLARRKAIRTSLLEALVPAAVGACVAVASIKYSDSSQSGAIVFGAAMGAIVGSMPRRSKGKPSS